LAEEMDAVRREGRLLLDPVLKTLYVGGGTPSVLEPRAMRGVAEILAPASLTGVDMEWTAEANPETFTPVLASEWRKAGVNRISLGIQSFQSSVLTWMGRTHGPDLARECSDVARAAGYRNISVDLMFGLPVSLTRDLEAELDAILALEVPHLSLYGLSVEPGTPLGRAVEAGMEAGPSVEEYRREYLRICAVLSGAGYRQYEVSNFALPGYESRHNRAYWDLSPFLGLGNGAHSFLFPRRSWNLKDWHAYQGSVRRGEVPRASEELLTVEQARLERVWLGLRADEGLHRASLPEEGEMKVRDWIRRGWARDYEEAVRLTPEGWLQLDRLAVELDGALAG
jgi:oxygen-independent coproporphyrinogen-3 oxidase